MEIDDSAGGAGARGGPAQTAESHGEQIARLERRVERERLARHEAESMLESKSLELYQANLALRQLANELEAQVEARTRELEVALDEAREATKVKGQFLATMSHEIRTPLFGVIGTAELLEESSLDDEQRARLSAIRSSGESLLALLNEILDFSKLDAARLELQSVEFDLEQEVSSVVRLFEPLASGAGLVLSADIEPQAHLFIGDKVRLRQIISNLLSNAVKFTTAGEVALTVATRRIANRAHVVISVRDTGPGIPDDQREVLFEEFRQGDPSTTRVHGGTGLGLAIVSRLAKLMQGDVTIDSVVGQGSVFTVRVVMDVGPERGSRTQTAAKAPPMKLSGNVHDLRILLVEDNPVNRMVTTAMLKKLGCSASVAEDGAAAVAAVSAGTIDVVLMDLQMPVLDGFEATRAIRALDLEVQPQIVALTANAFESDRQRSRETGMDDFLAKPFSLPELRALCERLAAARATGSRG